MGKGAGKGGDGHGSGVRLEGIVRTIFFTLCAVARVLARAVLSPRYAAPPNGIRSRRQLARISM
jgi:hypothetical protein